MTKSVIGAVAASILGGLVAILLWEERWRVGDWHAVINEVWHLMLMLHLSACVLGAGRAILDFKNTKALPKWHVTTVQNFRVLLTVVPLVGDDLPLIVEISLTCTAMILSIILWQWYLAVGFESLRQRTIDIVPGVTRLILETAIGFLRNPPHQLIRVIFVWLLGVILLSIVAFNVLTLRPVEDAPATDTPTTLLMSPPPTDPTPTTAGSPFDTQTRSTTAPAVEEPGMDPGMTSMPLLYEQVCEWAAAPGPLVYPGQGFPPPAAEGEHNYAAVFSQQGGAMPAGCPLEPATCHGGNNDIRCIQELVSYEGVTRSYYTYSGWCAPGLVLVPLSQDLETLYGEGSRVTACPRTTFRDGNVQILIDSERVGVAVRPRRHGPYVLLWEAAAAGWAEVVAMHGWVWPLSPNPTSDTSLEWSFVDQSGSTVLVQMTSTASHDQAWISDRLVTPSSTLTTKINALQRLTNGS